LPEPPSTLLVAPEPECWEYEDDPEPALASKA